MAGVLKEPDVRPCPRAAVASLTRLHASLVNSRLSRPLRRVNGRPRPHPAPAGALPRRRAHLRAPHAHRQPGAHLPDLLRHRPGPGPYPPLLQPAAATAQLVGGASASEVWRSPPGGPRPVGCLTAATAAAVADMCGAVLPARPLAPARYEKTEEAAEFIIDEVFGVPGGRRLPLPRPALLLAGRGQSRSGLPGRSRALARLPASGCALLPGRHSLPAPSPSATQAWAPWWRAPSSAAC